jgi:hypothetical protein
MKICRRTGGGAPVKKVLENKTKTNKNKTQNKNKQKQTQNTKH